MENERGLKTNYNLNDNNALPYKYKAIDRFWHSGV